MAGRWQRMMGRLKVRDALHQNYSRLLSYFCDPVSEFHLTYHIELISEDKESRAKVVQTLLRYTPPRDIARLRHKCISV